MKSEIVPEIIRHISIFSVALPLILYVLKFRTASKPIHIIGGATILSALSDGIAYYMFAHGKSTVVLFNSYYLFFFLLLTWFYYELLASKLGRRTVIISLVLYSVSFLLITYSVQPYSEYQTFLWTIVGMISIIYSISYFVSIFAALKPMNSFGILWINSGILFYFSFNLFMFIISSYVLTRIDPQLGMVIWSFHNVNNIIKNVLIGLGISALSEEAILK